LQASFSKYIELETLTGDNQYEADGFGKQDAERGVRFTSYPPVLTIHLKRFEFEPRSLSMVKINDRFEFPIRINLEPYMHAGEEKKEEDEEEGAKDGSKETYCLHSILVHSGDVHAGHYYAYIRPSSTSDGGNWYKYDDECVTVVSESEALEDSYGQPRPFPTTTTITDNNNNNNNNPEGEENRLAPLTQLDGFTTPTGPDTRRPQQQQQPMTRSLLPKITSSAYMLVYVRESELPTVMRKVTDGDIPIHLQER